MATQLADHGCYAVFLARLRRLHVKHTAATRALDDAYTLQYNRIRPKRDDLPSLGGLQLQGLATVQEVCFDSLHHFGNGSAAYRNLLPVLPCEAVSAEHRVYNVLDEYRRACPADGTNYYVSTMYDTRFGSPTRNTWIDVNITHTLCNNPGESRLTAAIPVDNPYCSCKLTRVRVALHRPSVHRRLRADRRLDPAVPRAVRRRDRDRHPLVQRLGHPPEDMRARHDRRPHEHHHRHLRRRRALDWPR